MKTELDMKSMGLDNWRAYRNGMRQAAELFAEKFAEIHYDMTVPESVNILCEWVGTETAKIIVASMVNLHEHDGRINRICKEWAANIGWCPEFALRLGMNQESRIHCAHLGQLAEEFCKL